MIRRIVTLITTVLISVILILAFNTAPGTFSLVQSSTLADPPTVLSIEPVSAPSDVTTPVTITGSNFTAILSGTEVLTLPTAYLGVNTLVDVTWITTTTLTAIVPTGLPFDTYDLTVLNPDGQLDVLVDAFTITWPTITPTIQSITPDQGPSNMAVSATITGEDFVAYDTTLPTAQLGNTMLDVTWISDTQLDVVIPAGLAADVYTLTVVNPGSGSASLTDAYTVTHPPLITGINPESVPNDLDTTIVITGSYFQPGSPAPTLHINDFLLSTALWTEDTVTATVPWGLDAGLYTITITNPDGGIGTLSDVFSISHAINVWETGGPYGGRIESLIQHPSTATTLYALLYGAGIFISEDGADNWDVLLQEELGDGLAMDMLNPNNIYAGFPRELIRTQDGGNTWTYLTVVPQEQGCFIVQPETHPTQSGVVYVHTRMCEGGHDVDPTYGGVFRSTDYGDTWTLVSVGLTNTQISALAIDPALPDRMLAGTTDGTLFLSTNGGSNWQWVANIGTYISVLEFNPYIAGEAWLISPPEYPASNPALYKSSTTDYTAWSPMIISEDIRPDGLAFSPGKVWIAAGNVYWSDNSGTTWNDTYGPNRGAYVVMPDSLIPGTIYAGGNSGAFKKAGSSADWQTKNEGLTGITPYSVASPRTDPDIIYGKSHELGLLSSFDGGHTWMDNEGFLIGGAPWPHALAVDPITHTRLYLAYDNGTAAVVSIITYENGTWHENQVALPLLPPDTCGEGTAVTPHPNIPGRLLGASTRHSCSVERELWRDPGAMFSSDDYGESWQNLNVTQTISSVTEIAFAYGDDDLVYAGTYGTGILRSEDGGESWVNLASFPGDPYITAIEPHPDQTDTLYALAETVSGSNIYVSFDRGDSWEYVTDGAGVDIVISPPIPDVPIYALLTSCGGWLKGTCRSIDGGDTWYAISGSPRPTALTVSSDGERYAVFVASVGGLSAPVSASGMSAQADSDSYVEAGVYRLISLPPEPLVYLPMVMK